MLADIIVDYAFMFIGIPYRWGGSNPMQGLDCSGYIQQCLAAIGKDPTGDQTAQSLYDIMRSYCKEDIVRKGTILFFGANKKSITHVALAYNEKFMLEAGGGGSSTTSLEQAIKADAFIRMRPIRKDLIAFLNIE
jgi:cell wall-associated NlpC family hydrolase